MKSITHNGSVGEVNILDRKVHELEDKISQLHKQVIDLTNQIIELREQYKFAKEIRAEIISITTYKTVKRKSKSTLHAKKVTRLSVAVDLIGNSFADAGEKKLYLLVYKGNKIFSDGDKQFVENKTNITMRYSAMKKINYDNVCQKIVVSCDFEQKLPKGKYNVEIYVDGNLAGKTDFIFK